MARIPQRIMTVGNNTTSNISIAPSTTPLSAKSTFANITTATTSTTSRMNKRVLQSRPNVPGAGVPRTRRSKKEPLHRLSGSKTRHGSLSSSSSSSSRTEPIVQEETVKVCVRIRPLSVKNWQDDSLERSWVLGPSDNSIVRRDASISISNSSSSFYSVNSFDSSPRSSESYQFDKVFGEDSSTSQIYDEIVEDIVASVCRQGRNGTVFTYGQTSTGKTFTMHGIIAAAGKDVFQHAQESTGPSQDHAVPHSAITNMTKTTVKVSYLELYNEEVRDLLFEHLPAGPPPPMLSIMEDRRGNVQISNLTQKTVATTDELMEVLQWGERNRTIASTSMNERSSRSHTIFRVTFEKKVSRETKRPSAAKKLNFEQEPDDDKENGLETNKAKCLKSSKKVVTTTSTLNLVDLAGSESVRLTNASGVRQKEGGKINQSLLTLSRVLVKLGQKESGHINYRDSKLTRILKPSLSGNARMGAICCISPSIHYAEESKSTLDFASRAMLVTTRARANETVEYDDALVAQLEKEMERVREEQIRAEEGRKLLEQSLKEAQEQIAALTKDVYIEKNRVMELQEKNLEFERQVHQLSTANQQFETCLGQTSNLIAHDMSNETIHELMLRNQELEAQVHNLSDEKIELESQLSLEKQEAHNKRLLSIEKRKKFKSKLASMTGRLREDMVELGCAPPVRRVYPVMKESQ